MGFGRRSDKFRGRPETSARRELGGPSRVTPDSTPTPAPGTPGVRCFSSAGRKVVVMSGGPYGWGELKDPRNHEKRRFLGCGGKGLQEGTENTVDAWWGDGEYLYGTIRAR